MKLNISARKLGELVRKLHQQTGIDVVVECHNGAWSLRNKGTLLAPVEVVVQFLKSITKPKPEKPVEPNS